MNCCGGDHKHDESEQKDNGHSHNEPSLNRVQIAAVLMIIIIVAGLVFTFIK